MRPSRSFFRGSSLVLYLCPFHLSDSYGRGVNPNGGGLCGPDELVEPLDLLAFEEGFHSVNVQVLDEVDWLTNGVEDGRRETPREHPSGRGSADG